MKSIFPEMTRRLGKFVTDNSATIMTGLAVAGTVATAVLTARATFKAAGILNEEIESWEQEVMPPVQQARYLIPKVWKLYVPPVASCAFTITCIVAANRVGTRRAAAMAAAYSLSEKAFDEYKAKVVEQIGKNKEMKVRDSIAQDRVNANPVGRTEVIVTGGGDVLCYDMYTGRYFMSSMEAIKKAQNDVNYIIINNYYASLSDLYDRIGLSRTTTSDEVGWNADKLLEIEFSTTMSDDQRPCIAIGFKVEPVRGYFRLQ